MFGGGGFGNTPSTFGTTGFGTTTNTGSVFGQPAQPQPATSLFGGGGTGFGAQQSSLPAFGSAGTTSTGAFGAQASTSSVFGQQARPATGIFSSNTNSMSPFSTQTQVAGTSIPFNAITGTDTMLKNGSASQINTRHQCITYMKEYENKSLEELRLEDYQLNRKGPQNPMFGGSGVTPQTQPGTSLFSGIGGAVTSTPGSTTFGQTSAFGQSTTNTGGLFGSLNQPKTGGFFGSTATPTSTAFGGTSSLGFSFSNPTSQPQQSIFGSNNNPATSNTGLGGTSAFSFTTQPQQQQQQGMSLFGQKSLTATSNAPTFGGGFGSNATNTTLNKSLFGAGTGSTFGQASTAPTFGTATGTSLFSTNTQQQPQKQFTFSTPFSSTSQPSSQPAFGGPTSNTSTFSFSNPVSTPTVNFGAGPTTAFGSTAGTTSTGTSFGAPLSFSLGSNTQQQQQPATGTTFGSGFFSSGTNNPASTGGTGGGLSLFGSNTGTSTLGTSFGTGGGLQLPQPHLQLQQQQQQQQQQQLLVQSPISFATTPFKDNQLFYNLISNRKVEDLTKPTNPLAQRPFREASRRKPSTSIGPSSFNATLSPILKTMTYPIASKNSSITKFEIFDGFHDEDLGIGVDILSPKTDVKKLVLKSGEDISPGISDTGLARRASFLNESSPSFTIKSNNLHIPLSKQQRNRIRINSTLNTSDLTFVPETGGGSIVIGGEANRTIDFGDNSLVTNDVGGNNNSLNHSGSDVGETLSNGGFGGTGLSSKRGSEVAIGGSFLNGSAHHSDGGGDSFPAPGSICNIICTRPGYYVKPSLEELDRRVDADGSCIVNELEIGRHHFGRIKYLQPVNVTNINLDEIVLFRHKEVVVYPDDDNKPELGKGLNVPAEIELERVWPMDKLNSELVRSPDKIKALGYEQKLRKACDRLGAEFVSYNELQGEWKFRVSHFSKYSCDLEENEEDEGPPAPPSKGLGGIPQQKLPQARASMGLALGTGQITGPAGDMSSPPLPPAHMALSRMSMPTMTTHYSGMMSMTAAPSHSHHILEGGSPGTSDVELNPLTPCDSDEDDDDDLDEDEMDDDLDDNLVIRRPPGRLSQGPTLPSMPKYKPILKDLGTEKSRLMKSVMSIEEFGEGELGTLAIPGNQPPAKKSRASSRMSLMTSIMEPEPDTGFGESFRLKQRLSIIPGPVPAPPPTFPTRLPIQTIMPLERVLFKDKITNDLFSSLRRNTTTVKTRGSPRVVFLRNGGFITFTQKTTPRGSKGYANYNQMHSYAEQQEDAPLSESVRTALEKQMESRLKLDGVLFRHHIKTLKDEMRQCKVVQVKSILEQELVIWELCDILWPGVDNIDPYFVEDEGFLLDQRMRLCEWLRSYAPILFGNLYNRLDKSVLGLLKKGLDELAYKAALRDGSYWLAVMLATEPSMLLNFDDCPDALNGMPTDTSDILALISGNMRNLRWLTRDRVLNMSNFEWLQFFALYLWFEGPVKSILPVPVDQAVRDFEALMREVAGDVGCPLPHAEVSSISNLAMHLLKMYSCTGYPLNVIFNPRTAYPNCLEYKMMWLLMTDMQCIGYPPDVDLCKGVSLGYVGMLEALGFTKWAHFVLNRTPNSEHSIEEEDEGPCSPRAQVLSERLMERNTPPKTKQEVQFLANHGVHPHLLSSVKLWRNKSLGKVKPFENMRYLMEMGKLQRCFEALKDFLLWRESFGLIGNTLSPLSLEARSVLTKLDLNKRSFLGWEVHGRMLFSYMKMMFQHEHKFEEGIEFEVLNFLESVVKLAPANMYQCAFLLEMTLSAQKIIQLLLIESKMGTDIREKIEASLVTFLEIPVPKEYFEGLRSFINANLMNSTGPFRIDPLGMEDDT